MPINFETAVAIILKCYPEKDKTWAEQQLKRACDNADGYSYEDILEFEFDIEGPHCRYLS